jgi:hypothetical protein
MRIGNESTRGSDFGTITFILQWDIARWILKTILRKNAGDLMGNGTIFCDTYGEPFWADFFLRLVGRLMVFLPWRHFETNFQPVI